MISDVSVRTWVHKILLQHATGGKIADPPETDPSMHTGTPPMRTGRKGGNFAYGEFPLALPNCAHIGSNTYLCCSQYAHTFIMQTRIPVCEYFSDPRLYAYRDPRMHTAIPICIILHMGIQDLISHMETISLCIRVSPYANVSAICKRTRVYAKNHLENC